MGLPPRAAVVGVTGMGHYPGTGHVSERGVAQNIINVPLPRDVGSDAFRQVRACP